MTEQALSPEQFRELVGKEAKAGGRSERHELLVTAAINWLNLQVVNGKRVAAWRVDTGRHLSKREDGDWEIGPAFGTKGAPDITGIVPGLGRRLDVDVKIGADTLSTDQADFVAKMRERGGIAFAFHDDITNLVRQFHAALKEAR